MTADTEVLAGLRALLRPVVGQLVEEALAERGADRPAVEAFIGVTEAARRGGVTPDTVRSWIARGVLEASRPPGTKAWKIRPADLERVLAGSTSAPIDLGAQRLERGRRLAESVRGGGGDAP